MTDQTPATEAERCEHCGAPVTIERHKAHVHATYEPSLDPDALAEACRVLDSTTRQRLVPFLPMLAERYLAILTETER